MFGIETFGPGVQAAAVVGTVLVEAAILYVVYGGLTKLLAPIVDRTVGGK